MPGSIPKIPSSNHEFLIPSQETHGPANNLKVPSHDSLNPLSIPTCHLSNMPATNILTKNQTDDIFTLIPTNPISPTSANQSTFDPPLSTTTPICLNPKPTAQKTPLILSDINSAKLHVESEPSLKLQTSPRHQKGPSKRHRDSNSLNNSSSKKPKFQNSGQEQSSTSISSNQIHRAATSYGPHASK